jgi:hypothetical protein
MSGRQKSKEKDDGWQSCTKMTRPDARTIRFKQHLLNFYRGQGFKIMVNWLMK